MFSKKKTITLIAVFCLAIVCSVIYAATPITTDWPTAGNSVDKVEKVAGSVWATVTVIVQILAVLAVVFAGLRYMFTSAEGRANIKKEMSYLAIGAVLVFGTTIIINFIVNAANELIAP